MKKVVGSVGSSIAISSIAIPSIIHGPALERVFGTAAIASLLLVLFYTIQDVKNKSE